MSKLLHGKSVICGNPKRKKTKTKIPLQQNVITFLLTKCYSSTVTSYKIQTNNFVHTSTACKCLHKPMGLDAD